MARRGYRVAALALAAFGTTMIALSIALPIALPIALSAASPVFAAPEPALKAGVFSPARMAPDFSLRGSDGSTLSLGRYRGKIVIVVFGFTSCPAVCPTTLATLAKARKQLGADATELQVVYVTVDPARDNEEHLREYLKHFDETFVGATGSDEELAAVRKEYGIFANREAAGESYVFNHSSYTYLVDRDGSLRALMPYGQTPEAYVHDVRLLLGTAPGAASGDTAQ